MTNESRQQLVWLEKSSRFPSLLFHSCVKVARLLHTDCGAAGTLPCQTTPLTPLPRSPNQPQQCHP